MASMNPYASASSSDTKPGTRRVASHPPSLPAKPIYIDPSILDCPSEPPISDLLYSGFVEHLGRGIYGGIVDHPENPSPADLLIAQKGDGKLGWRKDVMKILAKDGELEMPMLRWPGGNFVSNYHWQDGIGPISERPVRTELAWLSTESNKFGTDEFIDYARALNVEPYFCLNMGTGTYEEALAWLEYCNGTGNTYWANLRRKNTGRDEPHNVKYWGLGNEMHGPWQIGHLSAKDYAKMALRWAHGLRLVDPTIKLVSCGNQGNSDWDREVLQGLCGVVDFHSIHLYTMLGNEHFPANAGAEYEKNVFGPAAAERGIEICSSLIDLAKIKDVDMMLRYSKISQTMAERPIKICYDEWNVWDEVKAPGDIGVEQWYDYTDMLGVAAWLNVLVRKSKDVGIACIAQSVNVISPVMTSPTGLLFQTTYWPLRLFAKYMKNGHLLKLGFSSPTYHGPMHLPHWEHMAPATAYVDTVAIVVKKDDGTSSIRLSVLNRHPTADFEGKVDLRGFKLKSVEKHEVYHDDLTATNKFDAPDVVTPSVNKYSAEEWKDVKQVVRKHSWSFFIFEGVETPDA